MDKYELIIKVVMNQFQGLDYHLREDLIQELRIFIYQNREKIESEAKKIDQYLFVTLRRQVINWLKHSKYRTYYSLNQTTDSGDEYIDLIVSNESEDYANDQLSVLELLDSILSIEEKILLKEYYENCLVYKRLGEKYGVSADTIRRRIKKILDKVRKRWI